MRELTGHKVNGCNEALEVFAADAIGPSGAPWQYEIFNRGTKAIQGGPPGPVFRVDLSFQNGPIKEVGTNGITHEALLAILIDRLEGFQSGPYKCEENGMALKCLQDAQRELKSRTEKRLARGVEGTHAV